MAFTLSEASAGNSPGKKDASLSWILSRPSLCSRPMAVEVKLLLSENSMCGSFTAYGVHQPSATTWPWRRIMMLCMP